MGGQLIGIARHARPRGDIELLERVHVSREGGLTGDFRGAVKPGGKGKRQVTIMGCESWDAAMAELGETPLHWSVRRVNLLSESLVLPRETGTLIRIAAVLLEVTGECDPCSRMDEVAPGLKAALSPDWRGGVLCRVRHAGEIAIGDEIVIEERE